jgi:TonB family protein
MRFVFTLLLAFLASAAPAQTISGRVYDLTGAVISGAQVVLLENFNKITETKSGETGQFSFQDLKPGKYQVQAKQPWFQIFQQSVSLRENQSAQVYAALNIARAESEISITQDRRVAPPPGAVRSYRLGGKVEGLKRLSGQMPAWPEAALNRGASGTVVLHATVKTDRTLADIIALESPDPDLEKEAIAACQTWKYVPMKLNGHPVESHHVLILNFRYE